MATGPKAARPIPPELLLAALSIAELGSQTKAADRLSISQPAINAQLKRLESLVGNAVFKKSAGGSVPTDVGYLVLKQARQIIDAQEQLLRICGNTAGPAPALRLGLGTLFADRLDRINPVNLKSMFIKTASSTEITRDFIDGSLHFACVLDNPAVTPEIEQYLVSETAEPVVWVKAKNFTLSVGAPIPLVVWPGELWMTRALTRDGNFYRIAFNSSDLNSRVWAVSAGIGLTCYPLSFVPSNLAIAHDYYLPKLGNARLQLYTRSVYGGNPTPMIEQVADLLRSDNSPIDLAANRSKK